MGGHWRRRARSAKQEDEYIRIISDELKTDHVMLTQEEERECQRLAAALHEEEQGG